MNNKKQIDSGINNPKELMRAIIYGVAVGDALGFPVQFLDRNVTTRYPVVDMGTIKNPQGDLKRVEDNLYGIWSDDTSLTLCLTESLAKGFNLRDQAERMRAWLDEGYFSAREKAFDIGRQTRIGLGEVRKILKAGEYEKLGHLIENSSETANGNGALMRILPLLTQTYHLDIMQQLELITQTSALTHPHMRSVLCCLFYLRYAERLLDKEDKLLALGKTQKELRMLMASLVTDEQDRKELYQLCYCNIGTLSIDRKDYNEPNYLRSSGYVVHSLEAALWCIVNSNSYEETILTAVRLGFDTDTIAAISGGLAAIIYGYDSIPANWLKALKKPELFEQVLTLY